MSIHLILFLAFGAVAVAGAVNLLAQTHPINSALSLISVMAGALPGAPKTIGLLLFHEFLLPFEVTSILILIAIMGAVVLASKPTVAGSPPKNLQGQR